jgi:hypothetical protein
MLLWSCTDSLTRHRLRDAALLPWACVLVLSQDSPTLDAVPATSPPFTVLNLYFPTMNTIANAAIAPQYESRRMNLAAAR